MKKVLQEEAVQRAIEEAEAQAHLEWEQWNLEEERRMEDGKCFK